MDPVPAAFDDASRDPVEGQVLPDRDRERLVLLHLLQPDPGQAIEIGAARDVGELVDQDLTRAVPGEPAGAGAVVAVDSEEAETSQVGEELGPDVGLDVGPGPACGSSAPQAEVVTPSPMQSRGPRTTRA